MTSDTAGVSTRTGILLAYIWAAIWTIGPVAASWPHVFFGLQCIFPGAAALVLIHTLRNYPAVLGVLLLAAGSAVAMLAESRLLVLALGAAPAVAAGLLLVFSCFFLRTENGGRHVSHD